MVFSLSVCGLDSLLYIGFDLSSPFPLSFPLSFPSLSPLLVLGLGGGTAGPQPHMAGPLIFFKLCLSFFGSDEDPNIFFVYPQV